ncbi:MAG: ABC transporter permease subunit [Treponemataceae bacterium]|nr:ABC transporter permease subunit [Treponemataceae bacterium]
MSGPVYTKSGTIRIRRFSGANAAIGCTLGTMLVITVFGMFVIESKNVNFMEGLQKTFVDLGKMFFSPYAKHLTLVEALKEIGVTLALAFLTTLLGAVISLFLALLAAKNLADVRLGNTIKAVVAVIRAIPTVLWVLIFAIGAGLGAAAAIVGMTFHTVGYLLKAYSESYEEIEEGVIEALRAAGASWWQIVFQAVFPASITYILSWTFIRFEINFVTAVAMGAAAGAGGIGFDLFMASSFYFDLREVGFITYLILIVAVILELFANKLKSNYLLKK